MTGEKCFEEEEEHVEGATWKEHAGEEEHAELKSAPRTADLCG